VLSYVTFDRAGSTGRRNTGVNLSGLGFQIARSHVVFVELTSHFVQIGCECTDKSVPFGKVLSQQAVGCSRSTRAATALRIAK